MIVLQTFYERRPGGRAPRWSGPSIHRSISALTSREWVRLAETQRNKFPTNVCDDCFYKSFTSDRVGRALRRSGAAYNRSISGLANRRACSL